MWRPVGRTLPAKLTALHSRLLALPGAVREDRIEVLHVPALHARPFYPPVPPVACRLVTTIHDLIPLTFYDIRTMPLRQQLFYRWNLRRALAADAVITVSQASKNEILSRVPDAKDRLHVIPNAVDFEPNPSRTPLDHLGISRPYVLYAGSYEPRKNFVRAVAAFAELAAMGLPHRLVAIVERRSGHAQAALSAVNHFNLGDRLRLLHGVDEPTLRSLYTHADVLFFPSLAEGFGYPPLQAARCGTPVVASDLSAIREAMGEGAVYVNPYAVSTMARALGALLRDSRARKALTVAANRQARTLSGPAWIQAHVDLYQTRAMTREPSQLFPDFGVNP
jgi:glycosyltransferase involved in cell wall biosynthesis